MCESADGRGLPLLCAMRVPLQHIQIQQWAWGGETVGTSADLAVLQATVFHVAVRELRGEVRGGGAGVSPMCEVSESVRDDESTLAVHVHVPCRVFVHPCIFARQYDSCICAYILGGLSLRSAPSLQAPAKRNQSPVQVHVNAHIARALR